MKEKKHKGCGAKARSKNKRIKIKKNFSGKNKSFKGKSHGGTHNHSSKNQRRAVGTKNAFSGSTPIITGVLDCKGDRFGFVSTGDGKDDVFIPGSALCGARHGDTVAVAVVTERRAMGGKLRREGRVAKIVERNPLNIVATVEYIDYQFVAVPDDKHYGEKLIITELGGASKHDKVIIEIVPCNDKFAEEQSDRAKVIAVLGRFDEIGMDVKSVIVSHNLHEEFPLDVIEEADAYPDVIDEKEANAPYRRDFRNELIFTIDGSDSKDFDDAVSIKRTENGYSLGVYIADVAEYVKPKSPLDREAYERGTSVYLADRVLPMLPEKLSNGLCSLNEGEDRLALCVIIELDEQGQMLKSDVCEGVIRSSARLTYTGVQAILDGNGMLRRKYERVVPSLELMSELAKKRMKLRRAKGNIEFSLTETEIVFDANGRVEDIKKKPSLLSMKIIEEFMILANCAIAERFDKLKIPFVYRVHESPNPEKLAALNDYLDAVGIKLSCPLDPTPKDVAQLLDKAEEEYNSSLGAISRVTLRSMAKAKYHDRDDGHFGLAEKHYCHFTSPIRRYPDLCIHRIIKEYLCGGVSATKKYREFVIAAAERSSKAERTAQECERKVDDYKKAEYLSHHIGESFEGVISSVTEFGFFVELDNSAEGLVRLASISAIAYYDAKRFMITSGLHKYRLGDRIKITVDKVEGDKVDFVLFSEDK